MAIPKLKCGKADGVNNMMSDAIINTPASLQTHLCYFLCISETWSGSNKYAIVYISTYSKKHQEMSQ